LFHSISTQHFPHRSSLIYPMNDLPSILKYIFEKTTHNQTGTVADYIPQLATVDPDQYGMAFCDIHGKLTCQGDATTDFCLQSCSKPLTYCLARCLQSRQETCIVHAHVGYEPSGRPFNEFVLNRDGLPHNPLINAGAVMVASMVHPNDEPANRFETVLDFYRKMSGNHGKIGFDNSVFLSEKHHADRNTSLAYYMRENNAYDGTPTPSQLSDHLDLYFQACSITANCEVCAVIASTIANDGVCPVNGERVVDASIVKDVKAIMYGCGMYDFSGQFGFCVGLPAKSGVSGCVMLVIPNVGGLCVWSPRLDVMGNSVRGIEFCLEFSQQTESRFHLFSNTNSSEESLFQVIQYASNGDVQQLGAIEDNTLFGASDYDGRTPMHLACSEAQVDVITFLMTKPGVRTDVKDRWGYTPLDELVRHAERLRQKEPTTETTELITRLDSCIAHMRTDHTPEST